MTKLKGNIYSYTEDANDGAIFWVLGCQPLRVIQCVPIDEEKRRTIFLFLQTLLKRIIVRFHFSTLEKTITINSNPINTKCSTYSTSP